MVIHSRFSTLAARQQVGLVLGPALFTGFLLFPPFNISPSANAALASTLWIAAWWITEAIPIPATSLLPIVLFPLTGVVDATGATAPYADPVVFLLLGGFLLALGIERWGLHRRIALTVVSLVGVRADRLLLGFMIATAFLSMWISNSATAMLMVPIGTAVIISVGAVDESDRTLVEGDEEDELVVGVRADPDDRPATGFGLALMLGIAYSASIGGAATLIGSPPNAVFAGVAASRLDVQISSSTGSCSRDPDCKLPPVQRFCLTGLCGSRRTVGRHHLIGHRFNALLRERCYSNLPAMIISL